MSMQRRPTNPIEQRKLDVRRHAKSAVIGVTGGVVGGVVLAALLGSWEILLIGLVIAVVVGGVNWMRINKIINHVDNQ